MPNPIYDPNAIRAPQIIAEQLQKNRKPKVLNLSDQIVDVTIETSVQGASTLTLAIVDSDWKLLTSGFIRVDEDGLLEAIDINYGGEDSWWRLAACNPTSDLGAANLTLTFEDRIVSLLRDEMGPKASTPGETREQFIASCVRKVPGIKFVTPTYQQEISAGRLVGVGSAIATGTQIPAAAATGTQTVGGLAKQTSPARRNPGKGPGIGSRKQANKGLTGAGSTTISTTVGASGPISL